GAENPTTRGYCEQGVPPMTIPGRVRATRFLKSSSAQGCSGCQRPAAYAKVDFPGRRRRLDSKCRALNCSFHRLSCGSLLLFELGLKCLLHHVQVGVIARRIDERVCCTLAQLGIFRVQPIEVAVRTQEHITRK